MMVTLWPHAGPQDVKCDPLILPGVSPGEELKRLEHGDPGYMFCGHSLRLSARIGYFRPVFRLRLLCFEIDSSPLSSPKLSILSAGLRVWVCNYEVRQTILIYFPCIDSIFIPVKLKMSLNL